MWSIFKRLRNRDGATSIEYALIAMLVSITVIAGLSYTGQAVSASINSASNGMKSKGASGTPGGGASGGEGAEHDDEGGEHGSD